MFQVPQTFPKVFAICRSLPTSRFLLGSCEQQVQPWPNLLLCCIFIFRTQLAISSFDTAALSHCLELENQYDFDTAARRSQHSHRCVHLTIPPFEHQQTSIVNFCSKPYLHRNDTYVGSYWHISATRFSEARTCLSPLSNTALNVTRYSFSSLKSRMIRSH